MMNMKMKKTSKRKQRIGRRRFLSGIVQWRLTFRPASDDGIGALIRRRAELLERLEAETRRRLAFEEAERRDAELIASMGLEELRERLAALEELKSNLQRRIKELKDAGC